MKTPVLRPAVETIVFAFENIVSIVRIGWLPFFLAMLLYVASFVLFLGPQLVGLGTGYEASGIIIDNLPGSAGFLIFCITQLTLLPYAAMLLLACVYVAINRAAVEEDYSFPSGVLFFRLGPRELRFFLAQLLYGLFIGVCVSVVIAILLALAALAGTAVDAVDEGAQIFIITPVVMLAIWVFLIGLWLILRFLPVTAIAAVENRIAFGDAWAMTKGNFWRIIGAGVFFFFLYQAVVLAAVLMSTIPALFVMGVFFSAGAAFGDFVAIAGFILMGIVGVLVLVAFIAFAASAEISFPARIYAHLSGRAKKT